MVGQAGWQWPHLDDVLSYQTQKVVVIRDRRLGCLYALICAVIIIYVGVFQLLFSNEHFPRKVVTGTSRLTIQQPTKDGCDPNVEGCKSDFKSLEQLEYCKEYMGDTQLTGSYRKPCVFADRHSMAPNGMLEAHLLIPTVVESEVENKGCEPSLANGHNCDEEYKSNPSKESVFVADIENYMIHISHTYTRLSENGASDDVEGYYLECEKDGSKGGPDMERIVYGTGELKCDGKVNRRPVECLNRDCSFLTQERSSMGMSGFSKTKPAEAVASLVQGWARHGRRHVASMLSRAARMLNGKEMDQDAQEQESEDHHQHRHAARHGHHHQRHMIRNAQKVTIGSDGHFISDKALSTRVNSSAVPVTPFSVDSKKAENQTKAESHMVQGTPLKEKMKAGVWALPKADVFTIGKILALCDLDLDATRNSAGKSLREAGTVITIEAIYSNMHPWTSFFGNVDVEYEYRVTRRPVEEMATEMYSQYQPNFPAQRILEHRHGLYVVVKIGGEFGSFSMAYLFVLLATSAGLMKVANVLVDKIAMWFMKMKSTYKDAKYHYTERVWEMQKNLDDLDNMVDLLDIPASDAASQASGGAAASGGDDAGGGGHAPIQPQQVEASF